MRALKPSHLLCIFALLAPSFAARADPSLYERGREEWQQKRYDPAFTLLREYRRGYQGRSASVDYMLGTSACRTVARKPFGFKTLDWLIYAYDLPEAARSDVRAERDLCLGTMLAAAAQPDLTEQTSGVSGRGKVFHWMDRDEPVASYPIRRTRAVSLTELHARRAPVGDDAARAQVIAMMKRDLPRAAVSSVGSYVIASETQRSEAQVAALAALLDRFTAFVTRTYGLEPPPYLIRVYLTGSVGSLRRLASQLHGLDVSPSTIGYSFAEDMSLVAVTPQDLYGTVLHELTHLLVRGGFGDAPQWLDEGLASLYEVSTEHEHAWLGEPNWRGRVLTEYRDYWPTLEEAIASPWFAPDDPARPSLDSNDPDGIGQATMLAYNRYFLLYLQERGLLARLFDAVRTRGLGGPDDPWLGEAPTAPGAAQRHVLRLVEQQIGAPIAEFDRDYRAWLEPVLRHGLQRPERGAGRPVGKVERFDPSEP